MIVMLFGVSNVGKTTVGKLLAERISYSFYDLDEEIKKYYNTTLEQFMNENPFRYERDKKKGEVLDYIVKNGGCNMVVAVCQIYYSRAFNGLIARDDVLAIEL